ncbi:MAG: tRNA 2-thiouridine(34) synthase MnmA [Solirubrobacterales bacterium]
MSIQYDPLLGGRFRTLPAKRRVAVAMSGGVDSSVAAWLLKRDGFEVFGLTMRTQDPDETGADSAVRDARRVAAMLGIPHAVADFRQAFADQVIGVFCAEYLAGRTPNPCVVCNQRIKFGLLLDEALKMGADYLATGHYVRISADDPEGPYHLLKGRDPGKDQSYVLYRLNQQQLARTLFPLGSLSKPVVRQLAAEASIPVADKGDSQEICFVPDGKYAEFVETFTGIKPKPGEYRTAVGEVAGRHRGIHRYTIGQRKGLGLAMGHPVFVTRIDAERNEVWIGDHKDLFASVLLADDVVYAGGTPFAEPTDVLVKIRYAAQPAAGQAVSLPDGTLRVAFREPQRAITPGQSVVFYHGEEVRGGGVIRCTESSV